MPTPEEERRKRNMLERALASLQGAGESASRIAGSTFDSIANPLGEAVKDIRNRFTPTPAGSVDAKAFLDDSEYGPPASLNKLGPAVSAPPVQPVAAGDPMRPAATEEQKPPVSALPKKLGPALRGGRTQSEMWGLPGAEPVDLEGGDPVVNKLKPETILAYAETPSADISSDRGLGERGGLSFAVSENKGAAAAGLLGTTTPPQLGGGDLVDSWNEVKTAQKELGSFSDSAGKWWSVALAAMFPQYGSALNMIGSMKGNKYRAAMDKYEAAYKREQPDYMRVDDRIWDPRTKKFITEKTPTAGTNEYTSYYADTPSGTKVQQVKRGEKYQPEYVEQGAPYQGPTPGGPPIDEHAEGARYPYFSENSYTKQRLSEETTKRNEANITSRKDLEGMRQVNKVVLQGMRRQASMDLVKYRDDLKDYTSDALDAAQSDLENSIDFMVEENSEKKYRMLLDRTTRLAEDMKRIKQANRAPAQGSPPPAAPPAQIPTGPATRVME